MKSRTAYAAAAGLLLWYGYAAATECLPHPTEPSAVNIGSINVDTTVANSATKAQEIACVWLFGATITEATLQVSMITFSGNGTDVDTTATATILSRLRLATVRSMIDNSYLSCTAARDTMRLYHAGSVTRSGFGISTTFTGAPGSTTNYYDIEYYYPPGSGTPTIIEIGSGEVGGDIH